MLAQAASAVWVISLVLGVGHCQPGKCADIAPAISRGWHGGRMCNRIGARPGEPRLPLGALMALAAHRRRAGTVSRQPFYGPSVVKATLPVARARSGGATGTCRFTGAVTACQCGTGGRADNGWGEARRLERPNANSANSNATCSSHFFDEVSLLGVGTAISSEDIDGGIAESLLLLCHRCTSCFYCD